MIIFNYEEIMQSTANNQALGYLFIVIGLLSDGWIAYEEDKVKVQYDIQPFELMWNTNLYGGIFLFICKEII